MSKKKRPIPNKLDEEALEKIARMYAANISAAEIARHFKVTRSAVGKRLVQMGIKPRSFSDYFSKAKDFK